MFLRVWFGHECKISIQCKYYATEQKIKHATKRKGNANEYNGYVDSFGNNYIETEWIHRACVYVAILNAIFKVKNCSRSCYVTGLKKYPDFASTQFIPYSKISTLVSGGKKVAHSYAGFTRYVLTEAVSGKKKLPIQKYRDVEGV